MLAKFPDRIGMIFSVLHFRVKEGLFDCYSQHFMFQKGYIQPLCKTVFRNFPERAFVILIEIVSFLRKLS